MAKDCRLCSSQLAGHPADDAEPSADPGAVEQGVCAAGSPRQETLAIPQEEPAPKRAWAAKPCSWRWAVC